MRNSKKKIRAIFICILAITFITTVSAAEKIIGLSNYSFDSDCVYSGLSGTRVTLINRTCVATIIHDEISNRTYEVRFTNIFNADKTKLALYVNAGVDVNGQRRMNPITLWSVPGTKAATNHSSSIGNCHTLRPKKSPGDYGNYVQGLRVCANKTPDGITIFITAYNGIDDDIQVAILDIVNDVLHPKNLGNAIK